MRPETFKYKMSLAFDNWFFHDNIDVFIEMLPYIKRQYKKLLKIDNDTRGGNKTYGYDSVESIVDNMRYISDRYNCAFRLKWIIDGIENGKIHDGIVEIYNGNLVNGKTQTI